MIYRVGKVILRPPEPKDLESFYQQKNDPEIASMLGGHTSGYSGRDLVEWLDQHSNRKDEVLWTIVAAKDKQCWGHVGLYKVDHRIRAAELSIMIGNPSAWGKGVAKPALLSPSITDSGS